MVIIGNELNDNGNDFYLNYILSHITVILLSFNQIL